MISFWGPKMWRLLHCVTQNYPTNPTIERKKQYIYFFNIVPYVLPCYKCQYHFLKQLRDYPVYKYVNSKKEICSWLYRIHNNVNLRLNKKIYKFKEANNMYYNRLYIGDINKLLLYLRKNVQYGHLNINTYNLFLVNLTNILPSPSYTNNSVIRYNYIK